MTERSQTNKHLWRPPSFKPMLRAKTIHQLLEVDPKSGGFKLSPPFDLRSNTPAAGLEKLCAERAIELQWVPEIAPEPTGHGLPLQQV